MMAGPNSPAPCFVTRTMCHAPQIKLVEPPYVLQSASVWSLPINFAQGELASPGLMSQLDYSNGQTGQVSAHASLNR